jgi:electron transport complex protein RnfC
MNFFGGFAHGIHPPEEKDLTRALPIKRMPYPDTLVLPLRQHAGKEAKLSVKVGDHVERGDAIGLADGFMSVPIHASAAGTVTAINCGRTRTAPWPNRCILPSIVTLPRSRVRAGCRSGKA